MDFKDLKGKILINIKTDESFIRYTDNNGNRYQQSHHQDCCESVWLAETIGDLDDLLNTPILVAEKREGGSDRPGYDIVGWVFYELRTIKGSVTFRWNDESNGYYSTSVDFDILK